MARKQAPDGTELDFDAIYRELLAPAIVAAGFAPYRADGDRRGGSIHLDMFQEFLLAEFVVADLTLDNPNVWYEIGVRHALRAGGMVLTYALRDRGRGARGLLRSSGARGREPRLVRA